jgi:thioester reductase-like protein
MKHKRVFFLTGATGLVGSYLLKIFLEKGHKVYALSRRKGGKSAHDRVVDKLKFWGGPAAAGQRNLRVVEGDVCFKDLGITRDQRNRLIKETDEIFHSAAITDLNWPYEKIRKVNVGGTRHILEFARVCAKKGVLKKVNHISTACVYGDYTGVFAENDLGVGQKFGNTYTKTKFEAEKLVGKFRKRGLWVDIFRPPVVVGSSRNGKTFQLKHIYQFLYLCKLEIFDNLPLKEANLSIVSIDELAQAIYILSQRGGEVNKNYHPFPNGMIPVRKIINLLYSTVKFKKPRYVRYENFNLSGLSPVQKIILQDGVLSVNFKTRIDSRYTNSVLKRYNFIFQKHDNVLLTKVARYSFSRKIHS